MGWSPASVYEVKLIVRDDLVDCDKEHIAAFRRYEVEPYSAPIERYGKMETVVVVARKENEVIYWEDIEEGFNISPIGLDGRVLEHFCSQDSLSLAIDRWIAR